MQFWLYLSVNQVAYSSDWFGSFLEVFFPVLYTVAILSFFIYGYCEFIPLGSSAPHNHFFTAVKRDEKENEEGKNEKTHVLQ